MIGSVLRLFLQNHACQRHYPGLLVSRRKKRACNTVPGVPSDRIDPLATDSALDLMFARVFTSFAPAGLVSDLQQALLSLIANVTQQMQICSRSCSLSAPLRGPDRQTRKEP